MPNDNWDDLIPEKFEEQLEVSDSERIIAERIQQEVGLKYMRRPSTPGNLRSVVAEMSDRMRDEAGLIVQVFPGKRILKNVFGKEYDDPDNTLEDDMTFWIVGRVEAFDYDKMGDEVKIGAADHIWERFRKRSR